MASVLVVARGPTAVRIAGSCRALGLVPVTVPPGRADCVVRAAIEANVDAVHPGWGALAENPALVRRLSGSGIRFVGPPAEALDIAGDKARAVAAAERIGVPVLAHATGDDAIRGLVDRYGLPVVLKPPDGSQGVGVRVIQDSAQLRRALAERTGWYAERYVDGARVVGVTVAIDDAGTEILLGERESVLLAGNRKLVEAAPVLDVPAGTMRALRGSAMRLARALGLRNLATVEFLVHRDGYTFLEVNARLTGGYRICEARTGVDVIALQLELAAGGRLSPGRLDPGPGGHAMQANVYLRADARRPHRVAAVRLPEPEPGVLVDCALAADRPVVFDAIACQVLATGSSRAQAGDRLARAVAGTELAGLRHHGPDIVGWWSARSAVPAPVGSVVR